MKFLPILLLVSFGFTSRAQTTSLTVTMAGIGDIKVGMTKAEVEKLTGQSIKLVELLKKSDDWKRDTINLTHKNVVYQLIFDKDYINEKPKGFIVYEVKSKTAELKTKSGISIGDDKLKIVSTYGDYMMQIQPDYENDYTTKSKTRSTVWLYGDNNTVIIFYLDSNKITGFSVMYSEGC